MDKAQAGFELSPIQKLFMRDQPKVEDLTYRAYIEGELDEERLKRAVHATVGRHESLRTEYRQPEGSALPFQVICDAPQFSWDLIHTDPENQVPAHPATGHVAEPPLRVRLIPTAPSKHTVEFRIPALSSDAKSWQNFLTEVALHYSDQVLADEPVQYADFSQWHREVFSANAGEDSRLAQEHWLSKRPPMRLPFGRRLRSDISRRGLYRFSLQGFRGHENISPSHFLFACWQVLQWRMSGQDSITVSYIFNGRTSEELASAIGFYAHPAPVTCNFASATSFDEVLLLSATALDTAQRWSGYWPAMSTASVSSIGFEFRCAEKPLQAGPITITVPQCDGTDWLSNLTLRCENDGTGLTCEFSFEETAFAPEDVQRLARSFERIVLAITENPSQDLHSINLLNDADEQQILRWSTGETVHFSDSRCIHQLFEAQAALTPDRIALVFEQQELTYHALNERANQVAHILRFNGVKANVPVGICLPRSADMIVALLGVLKAGGAYVPLLPDLPLERMRTQLQQICPPVILTAEQWLGKLPLTSSKIVCLDRDSGDLARQPRTNPIANVTAADLIYILFTSGSTGVPKGVAVRHGNVANYAHGICRLLGLSEIADGDSLTFATVSTLAADLGNTSIFPALITGGCLVVLSFEAALDSRVFAQRHREHPIDVLKITPSNISALMAGPTPNDVLPRRFLILGGEVCTWDLVQQIHQSGHCTVFNHYGPTEATIGCLTYKVKRLDDPGELLTATVPLGRPLPNMQVYVLDRAGNPVPFGMVGEICIGGAGVAEGYLGKREETQQHFHVNPKLGGTNILYYTGDSGRALPDYGFEFLGRIDQQVKIRGHRVELTEIEAVLKDIEGVSQAAVLLSEDDTGQHIDAFVKGKSGINVDAALTHLRSYLPDYMIPGNLMVLDQFPLNPNGKLDRSALTEQNLNCKKQKIIREPRNEMEARLAEIWKEVLKLETVGIGDNFFELGGHSLLATQVISRVQSVLGVQVSIRTLFESATIEQLAQAIVTTRKDGTQDQEIYDLISEFEDLSLSAAEELLALGPERVDESGQPDE